MRTFISFAIGLFLSLIAGQIVAQQLAIYFKSREEFILVMVVLGVFAVICIAVLSVAFVASDGTQAIDLAAATAADIALIGTGGVLIYGMARSNWAMPTAYDMQIVAEIVIPALLMVLIQWWFVRRSRRKNAG